MNLFEKEYSRKDMPQVDTDDLLEAIQHLLGEGLKVRMVHVECGRLHHLQKEIIQDKVEGILRNLRKMESRKKMKPVIISEDYYIIDGHHRVEAVKKGWGEAEELPAIRIPLPKTEALQKFKQIASKVNETIRMDMELRALACLNGTFTHGRLVERGFSRAAINKAVAIGLLKCLMPGALDTIPRHLREGRILSEVAPAVAAAARVVAPAVARGAARMMAGQKIRQIHNGEEKELQVINDENGNLTAIDPSDPDAGTIDVNRDEVAPIMPDEEEGENDNSFV